MATPTSPQATIVPPAIAADEAGGFERFRRRITQGELGSLPVIAGLVLIWIVFQFLNPNFLSPATSPT